MTESNTQLRSIVDRIARLTTERKELLSDIADVLKEAASLGYDPKAIRIVVKRQLENEDARTKRQTVESDVDLIMSALGVFVDTPLGQSALDRAV